MTYWTRGDRERDVDLVGTFYKHRLYTCQTPISSVKMDCVNVQ